VGTPGRIHHDGEHLKPARATASIAPKRLSVGREPNPELAMAHKLAQLEVDRRAATMARPSSGQSATPNCWRASSACRYCGLLDASVAAHGRAVAIEPRIRTSVPHTWFLQADYERVAGRKITEVPYIVALSLSALGRRDEALPALRDLEQTTRTRLKDFAIAARTLLEGKADESVAAVGRIVASDFRDPEGLFYLSRHLAHLNETGPAIGLLERVVEGGFFCYPAMTSDPWLAPLRKKPLFTQLLHRAESQHREASTLFARAGGDKALGF
jgi:hypothetical protein